MSQAGWKALAKALEAVEENAVSQLIIEKEAAVIGSRVEMRRCLAKVEAIQIGYGRKMVKEETELDQICKSLEPNKEHKNCDQH